MSEKRTDPAKMEGEGDSRVHFSDANDPWSSSRHVAVLQALDAVEQVRLSLLSYPAKSRSLGYLILLTPDRGF